MPKIKLCKTCKHFSDDGVAVCHIPFEHQTHDLVLGTVTHSELRDPYKERQHAGVNEDRCGPSGKYWEEGEYLVLMNMIGDEM